MEYNEPDVINDRIYLGLISKMYIYFLKLKVFDKNRRFYSFVKKFHAISNSHKISILSRTNTEKDTESDNKLIILVIRALRYM